VRPGSAPDRLRLTLADAGFVLGLAAVGIAVPAALALWTHAFSIPRNDDWAYRRVLFDFARTGHISLVGWGAMTLIGQILWGAAFILVLGAHAWVPGLAVAAAAAIGLTACYFLCRSLVGRGRGAACALVVMGLPGFLFNTSSFMTDVPAFSAGILCLVLAAAALRRPGSSRLTWLVASLAVGVFGFSVRQFDLAAPVAVVVVLAARDRRHLGRYAICGACTLAACGAIYLWTANLTGAQHKSLGLPTVGSLQVLGAAYFTLAFFLSPVLPRLVRPSWRASPLPGAVLAAGLVMAIGVLLMATHPPLFIGNRLDQQGASAGEVLFGARPDLFPTPIWLLLEVVALGSGTLLAFIMASSRRTIPLLSPPAAGDKSVVSLFTWLSAAGVVGYALFVRAAVFDRYLWAPVFGGALLLAVRGAGRGKGGRGQAAPAGSGRHFAAAAGALALIVAAVTAAVTLNADAYDAARWSAGRDAVMAGFAATTVDAGFEWVGNHATTVAKPGRRAADAPPYETWYDQMFPGFRDCAFVSGSRLDEPALVLMRAVSYNELAFAVPERLYLYAVRRSGCGADH
jgi:hypothetical protein